MKKSVYRELHKEVEEVKESKKKLEETRAIKELPKEEQPKKRGKKKND